MSDFVQSLERGLAVIRAFDAEHPELTLSDVARSTGLTRAAARRFLHTLVELGYMRTDGRLFSLRPTVLELGYNQLQHILSPAEKGAPSRIVDARLCAVEALEGALLAREGLDLDGVADVEGLEEARIGELAVDDDVLAEGDGEDN